MTKRLVLPLELEGAVLPVRQYLAGVYAGVDVRQTTGDHFFSLGKSGRSRKRVKVSSQRNGPFKMRWASINHHGSNRVTLNDEGDDPSVSRRTDWVLGVCEDSPTEDSDIVNRLWLPSQDSVLLKNRGTSVPEITARDSRLENLSTDDMLGPFPDSMFALKVGQIALVEWVRPDRPNADSGELVDVSWLLATESEDPSNGGLFTIEEFIFDERADLMAKCTEFAKLRVAA